jgi:peptidyl-prolyl cis-trans isomerase C
MTGLLLLAKRKQMKLRQIAGAALAAAALALPATVLAQAGAKDAPNKAAKAGPIATVNGVAIPASRAEVLLREREVRGATDNPAMREAVREDLINRELIAQEAARTGYAKKPALQAELALVRQTVIVQHYVSDWLREHPVSEAEIQKMYDEAKAKSGGKEYKVRHILLDTEDEAKSVIAALDKGVKFEELAKKAFSEAMVKLDKGKYTEKPVHTRYGYHVIQVEDVRPLKFPPLEDVKARIEQQLKQQQIRELVQSLRAKAKIK